MKILPKCSLEELEKLQEEYGSRRVQILPSGEIGILDESEVVYPEKLPCEHYEFECFCDVNRITNEEGKVYRYSVDVQVRCKRCEMQFKFIGLPEGCLPNYATMGAFGYEARLPIEPAEPHNPSEEKES